MPLFIPPPSAVVVDENGYISIAGGLPYKEEFVLQDDGVTWRWIRTIKHPEVGEVQVAVTDHVRE
jgi:hypothetical protein